MTTYQEKLRLFAGYLDAHPAIAERLQGRWESPSAYVYADDWEDFQTLITQMGAFEKGGSGGVLTARHVIEDESNGGELYRFSVTVSGVCEARPKVDEDGQPVMRVKRAYVDTEEMEQEMEYECPDVWTDRS